MADEQKILNLISDIRASVTDQEELEERITKLKIDLENAEDELSCVKSDITNNREKLDELIDEATGQNEDDKDSFGYPYP